MKFGSNQSKPEFTVDLKGATIEMASKDKSSKKNVLEVMNLLLRIMFLTVAIGYTILELVLEIVFHCE